MEHSPPDVTAQDFVRYAGTDVVKWQTLAGTTVTRYDIREGVVSAVLGAHYQELRLKVSYNGGKSEMRYPVELFISGRYLESVAFPPETVALIQLEQTRWAEAEQEQDRKQAQRAEEDRQQRDKVRQLAQHKIAVAADALRNKAVAATVTPQRERKALEPVDSQMHAGPVYGRRDAADNLAARQHQEFLASQPAAPPRAYRPIPHEVPAEIVATLYEMYGAPRPLQQGGEYGARIYHFTSITNLPSILAEKCLWCDNQRVIRVHGHQNIAHPHLKDWRASKRVPYPPGGVVADYVPFYFATRSPTLSAIHYGNVDGYRDGQRPLVYLVSSVGRVVLSGVSWLFTDGNAVQNSRFYQDLRQLDVLDWELLRARWWEKTDDSKRRRHAEFLVNQSFPWTLVHEIGVIDSMMAEKVKTLLAGQAHQPPVMLRPEWYF